MIVSFLPFIKRTNSTVIYFNKELYNTDSFTFLNYSSVSDVGLTCDENEPFEEFVSLIDLFEIEVTHVLKNKTKDCSKKDLTNLHKCINKDCYNKFNKSVEENGNKIKKFVS